MERNYRNRYGIKYLRWIVVVEWFFFSQNVSHAMLLDPSEKFRPEPVYAGKLQSDFRNFIEDPEDPIKERVRKTYENMHTNQTVEFVQCQ